MFTAARSKNLNSYCSRSSLKTVRSLDARSKRKMPPSSQPPAPYRIAAMTIAITIAQATFALRQRAYFYIESCVRTTTTLKCSRRGNYYYITFISFWHARFYTNLSRSVLTRLEKRHAVVTGCRLEGMGELHTKLISWQHQRDRACNPPNEMKPLHTRSPSRVMSWQSLSWVAWAVWRIKLFSNVLSCGWPSRTSLKMPFVGSLSPRVPRYVLRPTENKTKNKIKRR